LTRNRLISTVLARILSFLGQVGAHEERSLEELDADDGEDELKQEVDDHDDEDILDGIDDAVEHRLHHNQPPTDRHVGSDCVVLLRTRKGCEVL